MDAGRSYSRVLRIGLLGLTVLLSACDGHSGSNTAVGPEEEDDDGHLVNVEDGVLYVFQAPQVVIRATSPEYPEIARQAGLEGVVEATFVVGKSGRVTEIIELTGPDIFLEAVLAAIDQMLYAPAIQNYYPARIMVRMTFRFQLN